VRIALATAIAAAVGTAADLAIEALGRSVLAVPSEFEPYHGTVAPYTIGGVVLAGVAYWIVSRFARDPRTAYVRLSAVALVLSWIPDLALLAINEPGATVAAVGSLMAMHAVSAAVVVGLLLTVAPPALRRP